MKTGETHGWCPACKEMSAIDRQRKCLWCGGETRPTRPGKPRGKYARLTDAQVRVLHRHHMAGRSIRSLGDAIYGRMGFSTGETAAKAISRGFRRLGLGSRGTYEGAALANRQRAAEGSPGAADMAAYMRWQRAKNGGMRRCEGLKMKPPGKGTRCKKFAAPGSDFCRYHDPARRAEVVAAVEKLREAQAVAG